MTGTALKRRARRALERQLAYQQHKAEVLRGIESDIMESMAANSVEVRAMLAAIKPLPSNLSVLEVGSGAQGLIFYFDAAEKIGVDPLADEYRNLFPAWQNRAKTIAAHGEQLPFDDSGFDIVLCDNVVDHAENPRQILREMTRVLKPGGLLYFTVNVHHPVYEWAASLHAAWRALGVPVEIAPFADHTVHLTLERARGLFGDLPFKFVHDMNTVEQAKREGRTSRSRHFGDRLKRFFFKNARWEVIAEKQV